MDVQKLFLELQQHQNMEKAAEMSAYMRNLFPFLGIPAPQRRKIAKAFLKNATKAQQVDWSFIQQCWHKEEREYQYIAIDYLLRLQKSIHGDDLSKLKELVVTKSWWDTVDGLDGVIGTMALKYPEIKVILLEWSVDDNFWLRRVAIDFQLSYKDQTDTILLEQILKNNFGQTEFFINKAIGWSLREYSKTNPQWVRAFIDRYRDQLAPLSIREGSKYI